MVWGAPTAYATHLYGGDVSMTAVGKTPGLYRISITLFSSEGTSPNGKNAARVSVYTKRGNVLVEQIVVPQRENYPLRSTNARCVAPLQPGVRAFRFYGDHVFTLSRYSDQEEYYLFVTWGARAYQITNLANSTNLSLVLYAEFMPTKQAGVPFHNSLPVFGPATNEYACVGKSFTADFRATDADGDQLRYSFVTPARNYAVDGRKGASALEPVTWARGISLQNLIPGTPTLEINAQTGLVRVTPTATGLYLFTVQCEEYRNGRRVGVVRRDFLLTVFDCPQTAVPIPVVKRDGQPARTIQLCNGESDTLRTDAGADWTHQWQRNGSNLPGETKPYLVVNKSGTYGVVRSRPSTCASSVTSPTVAVQIGVSPLVDIRTSASPVQCEGGALVLQVSSQPTVRYEWWKDGKRLSTASDRQIVVQESGRYEVLAKIAGSVCVGNDTLTVQFNPKPAATVALDRSDYCAGDTAYLRAVDTSGKETYQWFRQGQLLPALTTVVAVQRSGDYQLRVTNQWGCSAVSVPVTVLFRSRPDVQFDSIPPVCDPSAAPVPLFGEPAGGTFSGAGVDGDYFQPDRAGIGSHLITYTVTNADGCAAQQTRLASVSPRIDLTLEPVLRVNRHDSVWVALVSYPTNLTYRWSPSTGLSDPEVMSPVASPDTTTTYQVVVMDAAGCEATATVRVEVINRLFIPTAFSPNADGLNDVWELRNADAFPGMDVAVFNRWGEIIFQSTGYDVPWNGSFRSERVRAGGYPYLIRLGDGSVLSGNVTVLH